MTDRSHSEESDERPDPEEAAEIVRTEPALSLQAGDAMADDDARRRPDPTPAGD